MTYKVLIVDDSKLARMAASKALRHSHPDMMRLEASSAAEALRSMDSDAPDIALVDYNMPGTDGLLLVADLRERSPQMPIAVISANHQQEIVDRSKALHATFLPKPLSDKSLTDFLNGAVRALQGAPK
jgi:DNA-binding NarL/FixJ family response regulator